MSIGRVSKIRMEIIALVGVLSVSIIIQAHSVGIVYDDAFITYRYAKNIAAGHGFVYNIGEKVLGTTTPLWTILLATGALVGAKPEMFGPWLGIILNVVTFWLVYQFASQLMGDWRWGILALMLLALDSDYNNTVASGMETSLFIALMWACMYFQYREREKPLYIIAGLLPLVRPGSGVLFLIVLFAIHWLRKKSVPYLGMIIVTLIGLPWLIFSHFYFGSVIPNSTTAKLRHTYWPRETAVLSKLSFLLDRGYTGPLLSLYSSPVGYRVSVIFGTLLIVGLCWYFRDILKRKRLPYHLACPVWFLVGLSVYCLSNANVFFRWYYVPFFPILYIIAVYGLARSVDALKLYSPLTRSFFLPSIVVIILLFHLRDAYSGFVGNRLKNYTWSNGYKAAGEYLATHIQPGEDITTTAIGVVGYYSGAKVLDMAGLVSPKVFHITDENSRYPPMRMDIFAPHVIRTFRPTYVLTENPRMYDDFDIIQRKYLKVAEFKRYRNPREALPRHLLWLWDLKSKLKAYWGLESKVEPSTEVTVIYKRRD